MAFGIHKSPGPFCRYINWGIEKFQWPARWLTRSRTHVCWHPVNCFMSRSLVILEIFLMSLSLNPSCSWNTCLVLSAHMLWHVAICVHSCCNYVHRAKFVIIHNPFFKLLLESWGLGRCANIWVFGRPVCCIGGTDVLPGWTGQKHVWNRLFLTM